MLSSLTLWWLSNRGHRKLRFKSIANKEKRVTVYVFQDNKMLQVSVAALRIWPSRELSHLIQYGWVFFLCVCVCFVFKTILLGLVLDQSQKTRLAIKTPEDSPKTSNKLRRFTRGVQQHIYSEEGKQNCKEG